MSFTLNAVLGLLLAVPAALALVRYRKTDPVFHPFLLVLLIGFVNEATSLGVVLSGGSNALNYNLYSLAESVLLLWQFARWQAFRNRPVYLSVQVLLAVLWCWESFVFSNLFAFNSYHLIAYAAVVVVLSIDVMNRAVFESTTPLFKQAIFLVCAGLAVFHTCTILVELFWLYGLNEHTRFRVLVLSIQPFVNLFSNVLFTLAVLWTPTSYRSILRS